MNTGELARTARYTARYILRCAYPEEFEQQFNSAYRWLKGTPRRRRDATRWAVGLAMEHSHRREYEMLYREQLLLLGVTPPAPPVGRVSLIKDCGPRRKTIDANDAVILFGRGLTAAQIARYDHCTTAAVLRVLVPLLARQKVPGEAYWETGGSMQPARIARELAVAFSDIQPYLPTTA